MRRHILLPAALLAVALAAIAAIPTRPAAAQAGERCFSETGFCISGAIRGFWEQNGGLAVFGLPLGPQQAVAGEDGQTRQAQWFERARLELHPENPAPYNVLLGRLGVDRLAQQGRDWQSFPRLDPNDADAERCRSFRETGHQICGQFLQAFRSYGLSFPGVAGVTYEESLALFGLPISEAMTETIDGKEYTVQWFERARFELHPENQPPYNVLFGRLGAELGTGGVSSAAGLTGQTWALVSYGSPDSPTPAANTDATITFDGERVSGNTGCNGFGGSYTATATTITFGNLMMTLRACAEPIASQESAITGTLQGETSYSIAGGQLRITSADGSRALTYRAAAESAKVTGTVSYRQRIALPPEAVIQVQLVDVSRADAPATVIASTSFEAAGGQVPFAFELSYDPSQIDERNTYAVQARITVGGELRFISTQSYPVITRGNPTNVDIIVQQV